MRSDYEKFRGSDTEVIVVGPEDAKAFEGYWKKEDLPFIGLPDPGRKVLDLYGQEVKLFKLGRLPAQVLIDKNGVIRFAYYGGSMMDIASNTGILKLIGYLNRGNPETRRN